jgi:hypothetical protein
MLHLFCCQEKHQEVLLFLPRCIKLITEILKDAAKSGGTSVNVAQMKDFFKFAQFLARHAKKLSQSATILVEGWDVKELQKLETLLQGNDKFQNSTSIKGMCQELIKSVSKPNEVEGSVKKRKANPNVEISEKAELPKKKKKKVSQADNRDA